MSSASHKTGIEVVDPLPERVEAGATLRIVVKVSCAEGCALAGGAVTATHGDAVIGTGTLVGEAGPAGGGTAEIDLRAPSYAGEAVWRIDLPDQEIGGCEHRSCSVTVAAEVVPHQTSLAIWGVEPVLVSETLTVRAGATCSSGCRLGGQKIEVHDEAGMKVAEARLDDEPRADTEALYEARLDLVAPDKPGVVRYTVSLSPDGLDLPHEGAAAAFTTRCLALPQHEVTVLLRAVDLDASFAGVDVRLGAYRAKTNEKGIAKIGVPAGTYQLTVWRIDIEPVTGELDVTGNATTEVEVARRRIIDEDEERMWM